MLNCEICLLGKSELYFTKCCKTMLCNSCCDKLDKKLLCHCNRPLGQGRKNYVEYPQIINILKKYSQDKDKQCDRCDNIAEYDCMECQMVFCQFCNGQVHAGLGFSKHNRRKVSEKKQNFDRIKKIQIICSIHGQPITSGCDCGTALCLQCTKSHKQTCAKGFKSRPLKQFKEEYFINVLLKMRQLSIFKQKIIQDSKKYNQNFITQKTSFQNSKNLINQQFDYLKKMLEIKQTQANTKLNNYWKNCQQVYSSTCQKISQQIKKYDQYGQLLQKFSQNLTNLDYFQKKIKRFSINFQICNIKTVNIEQTQNAIMSVGIVDKPWDNSNVDVTQVQSAQNTVRPVNKEDARLLGSLQNTSQLIFDYTNNPTKNRQLILIPSHSQLHYSFIHLPFQNLKYQLEYGVGMKMKGQQIFKRINNPNGFGCIEGLNPNTKYRLRMRVNDSDWGPVSQITTLDIPKFNIETSSCAKQMGQNTVQLGKGGLIYGSNQINFGMHRWIIKLTSKTISYEASETACMSVGVSNKQTKKATFAGTTFNYGYQKSQIVLKILLDCNEKRLVIVNCTSNQEQVYQNLPNFPLYPTLLNKGNSQIMVRYNLASDDPTSC